MVQDLLPPKPKGQVPQPHALVPQLWCIEGKNSEDYEEAANDILSKVNNNDFILNRIDQLQIKDGKFYTQILTVQKMWNEKLLSADEKQALKSYRELGNN